MINKNGKNFRNSGKYKFLNKSNFEESIFKD